MAEDLVNTLADLKEQEAIKIVKDRLSAGEDPLKILGDEKGHGNRGPALCQQRILYTRPGILR